MREGRQGQKSSTLIRTYNVKEHYKILEKVGRGTYGTVFKARGLKDNKFYAIKKLQNNDAKLQQQGFPITALREITLLKQIDHPNIIKLKEIILSKPNKRNLFRGSTFLVFEYMDHDFAGLFKIKRKFSLSEMKCIFKQLFEGIAYLHKNKIFHRDIKSANILLNDEGDVKIADFGLGRKVRFQNMFTYKVVTLWYRAPELLWGHKNYNDKIDVWSIGCVVTEFFTGEVLFKKETQHNQMEKIYEICGDFQANDLHFSQQAMKQYQYIADMKPKKQYKKELANHLRKVCPGITDITVQFIEGLLHLNPNKRLSCQEALRHPFFNEKPTACIKHEIEKQEYQCHEMFKDRSMKIERTVKKEIEEKNVKPYVKDDRRVRQPAPKKEKSYSSDSRRKFSQSSSSSEQSSYSKHQKHQKHRSRSRSLEYRRRKSKSREERRFNQFERRPRQRQQVQRSPLRRQYRQERRIKKEDSRGRQYKERKVEERQEKYYNRDPKVEKRYKQQVKKIDRYERFEQRRPERREIKEDKRERDDRRNQRHTEYRRESKQKKYEKYQKRYDSRPYQSKNGSKYWLNEGNNNNQKDYKRRQQRDRRQQRRQERVKVHENGKYQLSKQKYIDHRSEKKGDKYVYIRQKGHRKKQESSSSSPSSYSSPHYKKQKQYRNKYPYDRKGYYKKQHSSSGQRSYN